MRHARGIGYATAGFGIQMAWCALIAFLPAHLEHLGATPFMIGAVLSLDPVTALFALPLMSVWSDRVRGPIGRRLPFLAVGGAIATIGVAALAVAPTIATAAAAAGLACLGLNSALGPYKAILADEFDPADHPVTSGIQSLIRELGTLTAFGLGAFAHQRGETLPYAIASVALGLSLSATIVSELRHPRRALPPSEDGPRVRTKAPSGAVAVALAQGFWWFGIQAAKMFVVLFFVHELAGVADVASVAGKAATERAVGLLALTGVAGVLASFPVGWAASRWPKARVAQGGLLAILGAYLLAGFATDWTLGVVLALLYGVGFATLQVLAYPLLLEAWPTAKAGSLAALGNLMIAIPQVIAMLMMGGLVQLTGSYRMPFWVGAVAAVASAIALSVYTRLKPKAEPVEREVRAA